MARAGGKPSPHHISPDIALGSADIQRSLRFNKADDHYLTRTPSSTGNQKIWTFSAWIKRTNLTNNYHYIYSAHSGSDYFALYFENDNLHSYFSPGNNYGVISDREFRDSNSWLHLVHQVDATNTVQKIWINGEELSLNSGRNPGNSNYPMNESGVAMIVGNASWWLDERASDMYLAEVNYIDGSLIAPTEFAFTEPQTGIWMPKRYEGTHGTNGYRLDFSDNSSTSTLGIDKSPNGNDFTANNFSVSAGAGNDSLEDTPTNNFCTLNALQKDSNTTLSEGNLKAAGSSSTDYSTNTRGTFAQSSGKWYYEAVCDSTGVSNGLSMVGWVKTSIRFSDNPTGGSGVGYRPNKGDYVDFTADNTTGKPTTSTGTVIQIAIDFDAGKIWFGSGGTYFESGDPSAGLNAARTFTAGTEMAPVVRTLSATYTFNFGQRPFSYTVPTGFKTLKSRNLLLTVPSIVRPKRHFDVLTYTGNGSGQTISGLEFKPDFLWIKSRTSSEPHELNDTVRGTLKSLSSNTATVENTASGRVTSFINGGYTVGNSGNVNSNSESFVAWCWKAGGTAVSNTDGSITSSVSANQEAGFSICSFTINTSGVYTIGHGLGKAPDWIMMKNRDTTNNWDCYHVSVGNTKRIKLNTNETPQDYTEPWNDTTPTSSVFTSTGSWLGGDGNKIIAYCWTEIPGYSKFGTYTGNASTDGTYVHLGFRPALVIFKSTSATENWQMKDNKRAGYNEQNHTLFPNNENTEYTTAQMDFLSNGFKLRNSGGGSNGSGETLVYMAWAEEPGTTPFDTFPNAR